MLLILSSHPEAWADFLMTEQRDRPGEIEIKIVRAPTMTDADRAAVFELFDASYRQANHPYLQRSIDRIGLLAIGFRHGCPCGFSLSNCRWMDLPAFQEEQLVVLHGMRCVNPDLRHHGLSTRLSRAVEDEMKRGIRSERPTPERELHCGRHGHANGTGGGAKRGSVPRAGRTPTPWQQGVGLAVAEAFGSNLDPATFVCIGPGKPIGYPNEHFQATEAELQVWAPVNRDRGDNLLVMNWTPNPPTGWIEED